jgi:hypothetical protein
MLSGIATTAMVVHLIPCLEERGYPAAFAGSVVGLMGIMALPGRLLFAPIAAWSGLPHATAMIVALMAAGCALLLVSDSSPTIWLFAGFFGAGLGATAPARAAMLAELYGAADFGQISGALILLLSLARAAAPLAASSAYAAGTTVLGPGRGYDLVLLGVIVLCAGSSVAALTVRFTHVR